MGEKISRESCVFLCMIVVFSMHLPSDQFWFYMVYHKNGADTNFIEIKNTLGLAKTQSKKISMYAESLGASSESSGCCLRAIQWDSSVRIIIH